MSDKKSLFKNVRVIIFILAILASIVVIHPGYNSEEGVTTNLNYGLDLEGGSWLQIKLQGALAQVDADPGMIVSQMVEPVIGAPIKITDSNLDVGGVSSSERSIKFTTSVPVSATQLELLNLGSVSVDRLNQETTQVTLTTSKEALIQAYLSQAFDAEVLPISTEDGIVYEIRTEASEEELSALMDKVGGTILKNKDGTSTYKEGVSTETRDLTRDILNDKLNSLGLKDIPVRTVGEDYILIDFAGIDLAKAKDIAEKPGKFEIRIQTTGNETQHVLYGDSIVSVGIPTYHDNQWHTPFTLKEDGARALQKVAIETGATENPEAHYLNMYLDENKIYGAPLSYSAASRLKETPIYSWEASTGTDEAAKTEAEALQIHLRAGALPVNVVLVGSGHVDASLGEQFKTEAVIAGLLSLIAVAAVVFRRYRRPEILVPMVGTSVSEVIMILGVAAAIGWQLDLAAIAGIIAAIGTGIDHLVIITDEVLYEGKLPPTKVFLSRIGKAFAIIFGAAATTIIAMSPLVVMGFGALKGFAITTIIGVFIGVVIARPVYGVVIKELLEADGNGTSESEGLTE
ncbi:preprotein translocase subunit SecD [Methanosarcina sp. 2.H.T.1A.6]|uniref:preprotein translocase subunit SecD n=1 Tax=unclassified Methanosarcina TaxID=2644672 RepID=UPI00062279EB|nr:MULTISPECIES: preprotein translocase subunit SecD [unclassified Methanosarcina]KKG10491.1 preprotein translocase subunit SecD [Methanosarcina sp. 2.H.T.1A.15]KKG13962.1 preprotein translocase subunit SecD [Methanosarcina sp. 2.H.T.1A.3]KKG20875.1 preprotein translocase subunit SecD [Methanosarcina sp. 2.H.T.1A.6]KKG25141.1 preprotein translocase subunit SecD [Methanosarcina sp. 2.H.T.1A.8]